MTGTVMLFQSTRPVWGATTISVSLVAQNWFQSTRPVWGATALGILTADRQQFQSTRPVWGATVWRSGGSRSPGVSIHAPRVGRD